MQEIEKERMNMGEDEIEEDFGDGYFAPYQKGLCMLSYAFRRVKENPRFS